MNIKNIKNLEDCYDGSISKEILFDEPVTKDFIYYLGKYGALNYYSTFAKPFYKIKFSEGVLIAKGVEGAYTLKITIKSPIATQLINDFIFKTQEYAP